MKRSHFIGIIIFCMLSLHSKGQSSMGVKADLNFSGFMITQSTNLKNTMKAGYSVGFFYNYLWFENSGVQVDIMFRCRTSKIEMRKSGETADYSYFGIEIPLNYVKKVELDDHIVLLGMGSHISYGLQSRFKSVHQNINPYKKDPLSEKAMMRRWDYGVGFIFGYEMKNGVQFNFNSLLGFRNLAIDELDNAQMVSFSVGLGVGYRF